MHRRTLLPALAGLPLLPRPGLAQSTLAQGWTPDRPIRLLVGFAAGGSTAEEFSTFQQAEIGRTAELVRLSGAAEE